MKVKVRISLLKKKKNTIGYCQYTEAELYVKDGLEEEAFQLVLAHEVAHVFTPYEEAAHPVSFCILGFSKYFKGLLKMPRVLHRILGPIVWVTDIPLIIYFKLKHGENLKRLKRLFHEILRDHHAGVKDKTYFIELTE